jgi:transposase
MGHPPGARPKTIQSRTLIMNLSLPRIESVIGLDIARDTVTLHDLPTGCTITVANTHKTLLAALTPLKDRALAVCEATGGHEDTALAVLVQLAIPVHRGDGGKISAFARSLGRAKTDRLDAAVLARYGRERGAELPRWTPPSDEQSQFVALVRRRADLVDARKIERTRARAPRAGRMVASFSRAIAFLDGEIKQIEQEIAGLLAQSPAIAGRMAVLRTLPGVGKTVAAAMIAFLPELGAISRRRIASLAALAPHPRDSGTIARHRKTSGGRRALRPILFLAALTAARGQNKLADFYRKLLARGKPKRIALVATMRKIVVIANARLAQTN